MSIVWVNSRSRSGSCSAAPPVLWTAGAALRGGPNVCGVAPVGMDVDICLPELRSFHNPPDISRTSTPPLPPHPRSTSPRYSPSSLRIEPSSDFPSSAWRTPPMRLMELRCGRRRRHGNVPLGLTHLHALPALAIILLETPPRANRPPTTPAVTAESTTTPASTLAAAYSLSVRHVARASRAGPEDTLVPAPRRVGPCADQPRDANATYPHSQSHSKTASPRQGAAHPLHVGVVAVGTPARAVYVQAPANGAPNGGGGGAQQQSAKGLGSPHPLRVLRIVVPRPLYEGSAAAGAGVLDVRWAVCSRGVCMCCRPRLGSAMAGTTGVAFPSAFPVPFTRQGKGN
ncbi:hypothetical protein B0H11DRAFT_2335664 [Mycena galericulata]|nr:hypothetical protein B0H11DRAFT_2335664 [Mycena galericulata]